MKIIKTSIKLIKFLYISI